MNGQNMFRKNEMIGTRVVEALARMLLRLEKLLLGVNSLERTVWLSCECFGPFAPQSLFRNVELFCFDVPKEIFAYARRFVRELS